MLSDGHAHQHVRINPYQLATGQCDATILQAVRGRDDDVPIGTAHHLPRAVLHSRPMKAIVILAGLTAALATTAASAQHASPALDAPTAGRFAALALACVQKEYPNKISHVLNSPADVKAPHELTPAFYGCYDWHSSVHGHWLLARLVREFPRRPLRPMRSQPSRRISRRRASPAKWIT